MQDLTGKDINRYHIIKKLGQGGMAVVYHAFDTRLERDVALKFIRIEAFSPEVLERVLKRFEKEGKALGRLSHSNIVQVYDYGEHEGIPFMVMEYLPGGTLKSLTGKPVEWRKTFQLLIPIAHGLAYAHSEGVVHRDVKPSNILLGKTGEPKLADFGIARILEGDAGSTLTGTGVGVGTPEYMAPEQAQGKTLDGRADVYSLGVVLYELITGRKPYTADTPIAVIVKQIHDPFPRPGDFVPGLPKKVERLLYKALAKDPKNRYENMEAFAAAMEKLLWRSTESGKGQKVETSDISDVLLRPTLDASSVPADLEATRDELLVEKKKSGKKIAHKGRAVKRNKTRGFPWWAWAGGVAGLVLLMVLAGNLIGGNSSSGMAFLASETPSQTKTPTLKETITSTSTQTLTKIAIQTDIPMLTASKTAIAINTQTQTLKSTTIPNLTLLEELGIGSTRVSKADGMVQVYVPAGEFEMGSTDGGSDEKPVHTIYLDSYWIDQTEVTNAMYAEFLNEMGNQTEGGVSWLDVIDEYVQIVQSEGQWEAKAGKENYPVIEVSWYGAEAYCEWAGRQLPTEAEWEKAARGTDGRTYPWGNAVRYCSYAQYRTCIGDTIKVGSLERGASPYGALDMAGNVSEWVSDWYDSFYYGISPVENPENTNNSGYKVLRGGSWGSFLDNLRSTNRNWYGPVFTYNNTGFRCLVTAP